MMVVMVVRVEESQYKSHTGQELLECYCLHCSYIMVWGTANTFIINLELLLNCCSPSIMMIRSI